VIAPSTSCRRNVRAADDPQLHGDASAMPGHNHLQATPYVRDAAEHVREDDAVQAQGPGHG